MGVGGAETMLVDIANGQVACGHRVSILVINDIENKDLMAKFDPRIKISSFHRKEGDKPLLLMLKLNMLVLLRRPDMVHIHNHKLCALIRVRRRRHLLFTVHDVHMPLLYARGTNMAAITDAVRNDVLKRVPKAKIRTVLNGIRIADIIRRIAGEPTGVVKLVQVARLAYEKKGQDVLIKAVGLLHRRGIDNVEVTFIGGGYDEHYLRDLAHSEGIDECVKFAGMRDRNYIYNHLCDFDAMCHPSRYEGFGLTVAEGMAAGLPLIVTEGDGPWEVADHGRLCISVPNGDAEALADAIVSLMENRSEAQARAAEALDYVQRFDISRTVEDYERYYREIIGR